MIHQIYYIFGHKIQYSKQKSPCAKIKIPNISIIFKIYIFSYTYFPYRTQSFFEGDSYTNVVYKTYKVFVAVKENMNHCSA